jgi:RsiW-degrading membrane proteinase PrsW (M82 family)
MNRSTSRNVLWGVKAGLFFASFYSLFVLLLYAFRGEEPSESKGVSLLAVVVTYFIGGVLGGAIVGLLRPFTRERWGAIVVGMIAALPVVLGFSFAMYGSIATWEGSTWGGTLLTTVVLGTIGALAWWEPR